MHDEERLAEPRAKAVGSNRQYPMNGNGNGVHAVETRPVGPAPAKARTGVVVAIPAYNEEVGIGSVVLRAREHADEVVVVDDASTDATARVAERAGARVIRHEDNGGYGAALRTIFRTAREEGWPGLVILDSDGQHNPEDVPRVAAPVMDGKADVAIGSRFVDAKSRRDVPRYRQFGIKVLTGLTNVGASRRKGTRVTDGQSGFRAYSRRAVEAINPTESGMGISAEILFQARAAHLRFKEVPVNVRYDVDGSSQNPVKHGMGVIRAMIRYVEVKHPLLFLTLPGLALLTAGLHLGLSTVPMLQQPDVLWPVEQAVVGGILAMGGLLLAVAGLAQHAAVSAVLRGRATA